ncbi:hypothetical protein EX30DRAFT_343007 [Ascodesmis nigricans]|uniref:Uncharacterized protein n=1 Tax=Ascodesmis nigricans TaxID=341454 RepID=A0A4S2MNB5_9PEZI|nr:hypothetical protein EX30DRAFT_343007 [Ascodesmis nigricans]
MGLRVKGIPNDRVAKLDLLKELVRNVDRFIPFVQDFLKQGIPKGHLLQQIFRDFDVLRPGAVGPSRAVMNHSALRVVGIVAIILIGGIPAAT